MGSQHSVVWRQDGSVWSTRVKADSVGTTFVQVISSDAMVAAAGKFYTILIKHDGNAMLMGMIYDAL